MLKARSTHSRWSRQPAAALILGLIIAAAGPLAAQNSASVLTYHNDNSLSGLNQNETILAPTDVSSAEFGKLFEYSVDGWILGQPLYVPNVNFQTKGIHNAVYVATNECSVYAFDADSNLVQGGLPLWRVKFVNSTAGVVPFRDSLVFPSAAIDMGIVGTPVIDASTSTLYCVVATAETNGGVTTFPSRLHALDLATGAEKFGGPMRVRAKVLGTGDGSVSGTVQLDDRYARQRTGLALANGIVYFGYASRGTDQRPYHGWLFGYSASTLLQVGAFNPTRNGYGGGIWQSGASPSVDADGNVYVAVGNGTNEHGVGADIGGSILKLGAGSLGPMDYFIPYNVDVLNQADVDVGSTGVMLLPDQPGATGPLCLNFTKQGRVYMLRRDGLGGFNMLGDNAAQSLDLAPELIYSNPAYFNGTLYLQPDNQPLGAYPIINGQVSSLASSQVEINATIPGASPSISSNGATNGILWMTDLTTTSLRAYDATDLGTELYDSNQVRSRDHLSGLYHWMPPTVVNGKVYVGEGGADKLAVFGRIGNLTARPSVSPDPASYTGSVTVSLADVFPGAVIYYTTDGSTPTAGSNVYTSPLTLTGATTLSAMAAAPGMNGSPVVTWKFDVTPNTATPSIRPNGGPFVGSAVVSLFDTLAGATIHYTTDGSTPTQASATCTGPFTLAGTGVVNAIAVSSDHADSAVASATFTVTPQADTPVITPAGGLFVRSVSVSLSDDMGGATIYYTVDGSAPTTASTVYTGPFVLTHDAHVHAIAAAPGLANSKVAAANFLVYIPTSSPTITPNGGAYSGPVSVTLQEVNTQAAIYYTTDGSTPTTDSTLYKGPISITRNVILQAIAVAPGSPASSVVTAKFTVEAAAPTITPNGGNFSGSVSVTLTDSTPGASLYYTLDTSTPTTTSHLYTGPLTLTAYTTVKAIAVAGGYANSAVSRAVFYPILPTPTITPNGASFAGWVSVSLADKFGTATLYYTTDGTTPTTSSAVYTGPFTLSQSATVRVMAAAPYHANSAVASAVFTLLGTAAPTISPNGGNFLGSVIVTLADDMPGLSIYYTLDTSTPTTSSHLYTGPITVSAYTVLKAMATAPGYTASAVMRAVFYPILPTPMITPNGGTFSGAVSVSLANKFATATLYYTTDGTTPTTSSPVYTGPFTLTQSATVQVMATAPYHANSGVANAVFVNAPLADAATISPNGGNFSKSVSVVLADSTPGSSIYYTIDATTPTTSSHLYTGPITLTAHTTLKAMATASGYVNSAVVKAVFYPILPTPTITPNGGTFTGSVSVSLAEKNPTATLYYTTDGTTPTTSSPVYTGPFTLTQSATVQVMAAAPNYANSAVASAVFTVQ